MKNSLLLYYADDLTDDALLLNGVSFVSDLESRLSSISGIDGCFYSLPGSYAGALSKTKNSVKRKSDDPDGWTSLFDSHKIDNIIKVYIDSPFADAQIISEMLNVHTE